jgi:hypothetical protein
MESIMLFNQNLTEKKHVEEIEANVEKNVLGIQLVDAFHDKQNPQRIQLLVNQGAPVNYRLDYGLEVKYESDFVAQFFLLLEGDKGQDYLLKNATKILGNKEQAIHLVNYVSTGLEIFNILHAYHANHEEIKVNPEFFNFLLNNAIHCRGNPDHENGSLILAAGIRNTDFVKQIINKGKYIDKTLNDSQNGAAVNFRGYFGDNAAVWSAILLDKDTLSILLDHGSDIHDIGVTKSSLLHWVAVADRLESKPERQQKSIEIAEMLLKHHAKPDIINILGKTPIDYASGNLKELLLSTYILSNKI